MGPYRDLQRLGEAEVAMRLSSAVMEALKRAAKADGERSMVSLMEKILADWLRENGFLKKKNGNRNGNGNG
jgi:hypothetical protein